MKRVMDNITKTKETGDDVVKIKKSTLLKVIKLFKPKSEMKTENEIKKGKIIRETITHLKKEMIPLPIARKVQRILEIENSFLLGFCETVKFNLDLLFRYLYFTAFLLQVAF